MQSSPIQQSGQIFTLSMSGKEGLPLRAGEIVTAEVMQAGMDNTATIKLKNNVIDVRTDIPLQKGDTLSLRVERQENTIYLRLAGHTTESVETVKSSLLAALNGFEKLGSGTDAMSRLVDLLKMMPQHIQENLPEIEIINRFLLQINQLTGKTLQDAVMNGGVFFEAKLRIIALGREAEGGPSEIEAGRIIAGDLKASLLRLKDMFLSPVVLQCLKDTIRPDELIDALNNVLRNIEFYQLQSKLTDTLQFFLPLVWSQLSDGEIILRESDQGQQGGHSYSCTINLDLKRVGKLRVSLLFQGGYIHVNCAAENGEFSRVLQDGAEVLEQQFRASGLRLGNLAVLHQPEIRFSGTQVSGLSIHV